jgi:hypothetical protein
MRYWRERRTSRLGFVMKEPPDRWSIWVGTGVAFVVAVTIVVLVAVLLFLNSHPLGLD